MPKVIIHKQNLIKLLGITENDRVLDYDCDQGDFIELLLRENPRQIWAVGSNSEIISHIKNNFAENIKNKLIISKVMLNSI